MSIRKKVAIVGAGMVGVSTAIWLQRSGHEVVLIDRLGVGEGASLGNAGLLTPSSVLPVTMSGLPRRHRRCCSRRGNRFF